MVRGGKRHRPNSRCAKRAYDTQRNAEDAIHAIMLSESDISRKIPTRAYPCPFCGKWHLTSGAQKSTRRK